MFRYYIFCICFFQLVNSYTLLERAQHTASYVDNKIYFIGGSTFEKEFTNDFFYLDVSKPFTLGPDLPLPIVDLSNSSSIPNHRTAMSTVCGSNKDTIFLFGGEFEDNSAHLVYTFNTSSPKRWTSVNGKRSPTRHRLSAIACYDKNAKIYSFGGTTIENSKIVFYNDLNILDTDRKVWLLGSSLNIPPPMDSATASLLLDGKIVYLGGNMAIPTKFVKLSEIYIYDTNHDGWSTMYTSGPPEPRAAHTAVLTLDGRIIICGGILENLSPASDPLLVLDTTAQPFKWSIPNVDMPIPTPVQSHTATLVGNYMIVAFGLTYTNRTYVRSKQIYLFDVSDKDNYKVATKFIPISQTPIYPTPMSPTPSNTPPALSQPPTSLRATIGGIIGGIVVVVISISIIFLIYRRNNRKRPVPTPGS